MAVDFYIKQDDLLPELQAILKDATLSVIDLTFATGVRFIMTDKVTGDKKVDAVATIVDDAGGIVKYSWETGDTDTFGSYKGEFEVQYPGGKTLTVPNYTYINIKVVADLGGVDATP